MKTAKRSFSFGCFVILACLGLQALRSLFLHVKIEVRFSLTVHIYMFVFTELFQILTSL